MPKPLLRLLAIPTASRRKAQHSRARYIAQSLPHVAPEYLEYIISQVQAEGYHVEYIARFVANSEDSIEAIDAIKRWAKRADLKISINHERGICFFEKR
jgi:hypothetical protein